MKNYFETYYPQILKASKNVKSYREDITKHDKKALQSAPFTDFLYATRETGTDILKLPTSPEEIVNFYYVKFLHAILHSQDPRKTFADGALIWIHQDGPVSPRNENFYIAKSGRLKNITGPQVHEVVKPYVAAIINFCREHAQQIEIAYIEFRQDNSKYKLKLKPKFQDL